MITVPIKVDVTTGRLKAIFTETYPTARTVTLDVHVDPADGFLYAYDDRDYPGMAPQWRRAKVNAATGKLEVPVPRYTYFAGGRYLYWGEITRFMPVDPPPPDPPTDMEDLYFQAQYDATDLFEADVTPEGDNYFLKKGTTRGKGDWYNAYIGGGYYKYPLDSSVKAGALDAKLLVGGKRYYDINIFGDPPTLGRVDSGQVDYEVNDGPASLYPAGHDLYGIAPTFTLTAEELNDQFAASGQGWEEEPIPASYLTQSIDASIIQGISGTDLYIWFLTNDPTFPLWHATAQVIEQFFVYFQRLWVLY